MTMFVGSRRGNAPAGLAGIVLIAGIGGLAGLTAPGAALAENGSGVGTVAGSERPAAAPLPVPEPVDLPREVQELSVRYRDIFTVLAAGRRAEAIERAAALETQALAATPGKALEWLSMADGAVLGSYLEARPDCALPLALFYQRLVLAHSAHRRYGLTHRALVVASGLFAQMARAAQAKASAA